MLKLWRAHLESADTRANVGRSYHFWISAVSHKAAKRAVEFEIERFKTASRDGFNYLNEHWFPIRLQMLLQDGLKFGFDKIAISSGKSKVEHVFTNWIRAVDCGKIPALIESMGLVEDEGWVNGQKEALKLGDHEMHYGLGSQSVIGGINHSISMLALDTTYEVYGSGGFNRWFMQGTGEIRFSPSHALSVEKTFVARMLGFEMSNMPGITQR